MFEVDYDRKRVGRRFEFDQDKLLGVSMKKVAVYVAELADKYPDATLEDVSQSYDSMYINLEGSSLETDEEYNRRISIEEMRRDLLIEEERIKTEKKKEELIAKRKKIDLELSKM